MSCPLAHHRSAVVHGRPVPSSATEGSLLAFPTYHPVRLFLFLKVCVECFGIEAIGVDRDVAGGTSGCFQLAMRFNRLCVYDVLRDGGVVV